MTRIRCSQYQVCHHCKTNIPRSTPIYLTDDGKAILLCAACAWLYRYGYDPDSIELWN